IPEMKKGIILALVLFANVAHAANIVVSPSNMHGWNFDDMRFGGTATISGDYPRSGNESLKLTTSAGADKASFGLYWSPFDSGNPFGGTLTTLGSLTNLSYDWYRDSTSTVP